MYGMIHRAIRSMFIEAKGESAWTELERRSQLGAAEMISAEVYDDEVTLSLLGAASESLEIPMDELLIQFGKYWIVFAQRGSFSHIMDFTGRDIYSFIGNLDRMHEGVQAVLPHVMMPSFKLVETSPGRIVVAYRTPRSGLEPFVLGLMQGLLDKFALSGSVEQGDRIDDAAIFILKFNPV